MPMRLALHPGSVCVGGDHFELPLKPNSHQTIFLTDGHRRPPTATDGHRRPLMATDIKIDERMSCMSYVVCLIYCITVRLVLILLVYVNLFQHYCTGATMKTRLSDVVSV